MLLGENIDRYAGWNKRFDSLDTRPMTRYIKENMNPETPLTGVEIGVAKGENAETILQNLNIEKLYLVDPYLAFKQKGKWVTSYIKTKEEALLRLDKYSDKIEFLFDFSYNVADKIPNNLDFIYIDGNHSYETVKKKKGDKNDILVKA